MRHWIIAGAIIVAGIIIAGAIVLRPNTYESCVSAISANLMTEDPTATLDPRDVTRQAEGICAGRAGSPNNG